MVSQISSIMQNTIYRVGKTKEFIKDNSCLFIKLNFKDNSKNIAINGNLLIYKAIQKL